MSLARALAPSPQVLLLDEPLSALDARIRAGLREDIRALQRKLGITTIFVTHDQEEALSISDRIVVMNAGAIEQVGSPSEIYDRPRTRFVASFVGTLNTLQGVVVDPAEGAVRVGAALLRARAHRRGKRGETPSLALRPEVLRLGLPADGANTLTGAIKDVTFSVRSFACGCASTKARCSSRIRCERRVVPRTRPNGDSEFLRDDLIVLDHQ